ncbi:MAG: efflux RND transporter permease subunit [Myxococcales bacterium]|nr:efflux RND transporter permease subunit [Myxococcales bacterium]
MKIIDTAIQLRVSALVLAALLAVGGVYAYVTLPKESNPSIEIPNIIVTTVYPGASPDDVENLITEPIEREVQGISGIDEIRSTSTEGMSTIVIEFTPDIAIDEATQKVRDKVDLARPKMPSEAEDPIVSEIDLSEFPIMSINLAAEYPLARLKQVAEEMQDELETIGSVLGVDLIGGLEREVQVDVKLSALQAYNIKFTDVLNAIRNENTNLPGGSINVESQNYLIRVNGQFAEPREIEDVVVKAPQGKPIYIRDLADVRFGFKERQSYSRLRVLHQDDAHGVPQPTGQTTYAQVITLNVKKRSGENILETAAAAKKVVADFPLPEGTRVLITGDQSKQVENLVKDLENNIISGLIFVVAVLVFFLGLRTSLLVGVAIPLSMGVTFIVFMAMGQTLNFIILFSLIIALGMMVDNAIVIVENIYRFLEEGHDHFTAARMGTNEVGMAVVSSTATTVAAFVPMLFWPGIIGEFMGFMPLTLIITLSSSLFVAIVINPVLTGYFAESRPGGAPHARNGRRARLATTIIAGLVLAGLLGLANPTTLAVLVASGLALMVLHFTLLGPLGRYFMNIGVPAVIGLYRRFLEWMLERDYTAKGAYWRNCIALLSFGSAFIIAFMGGIVAALLGKTAAMILLVPAGILGAIGLLGILVHTFECLVLGAGRSILWGVVFGLTMLGVLGLIALGRPLEASTIVELLAMPAAIVACGVLGLPIKLIFKPRRFILTDNRARLLNCTLGGLFGIIAMFAVSPTGSGFFPDTDPNQVQIVVDGPLGTHLDATNALAVATQERLDAMLVGHPVSAAGIANILVNVGVGGGGIFGGGSVQPESATIRLNMVDFEDRQEPSRTTLSQLRHKMEGIVGADVEFKRDKAGPPTGPPVNIEVTGPRFAEIVRISREIKERLAAAVEAGKVTGLVDLRDNLNTGRPELRVRIDRERAARFGLNTQQIASTIRTAINGTKASVWRDGGDEYDITVRLAERDRRDLDSLRNLTIAHENDQIPVVTFADFDIASGLGSITRKNLQRVVTVMGNVQSGMTGQALLASVQAELKEFEANLPAGYTMKYTGESEDQQESFSFLTTALITGSSLILMILIAQFNSVGNPFIIMVAVVLSLTGVLLGLLVTRTPFNLFTFIGVISLAGIVVNNNIVLIDYIQQLRSRGYDKRDAVVEAGATRLRPVFLTAMTTVLGLIPLTFGINIDFVGFLTEVAPDFRIGSANTQFWGPMGTTIISGLTFATFLTLVIVPVMYSAFDSLIGRLRALYGLPPREDDAPSAVAAPAAEVEI